MTVRKVPTGRNRQARGVTGDFIRAVIACEIRSYASNIVVWPPGEHKPIRGRDIRRDSGWVLPEGKRDTPNSFGCDTKSSMWLC